MAIYMLIDGNYLSRSAPPTTTSWEVSLWVCIVWECGPPCTTCHTLYLSALPTGVLWDTQHEGDEDDDAAQSRYGLEDGRHDDLQVLQKPVM